MVSKPFVCENNETAGGIKVEELPGNFGHPWATKNWGQPLFVWYPTYFAGLQFFLSQCLLFPAWKQRAPHNNISICQHMSLS